MSHRVHAFRLTPNKDLKESIQAFVDLKRIDAGVVIACVGSLVATHIRFANRKEGKRLEGHFEILTLTGTVSRNGSHLHIMVADSEGQTLGGHVLPGNLIYTTAEVVIQEIDEVTFVREPDQSTGFAELVIKRKSP